MNRYSVMFHPVKPPNTCPFALTLTVDIHYIYSTTDIMMEIFVLSPNGQGAPIKNIYLTVLIEMS